MANREPEAHYTHKQVIVLRKDLNMRKGKMVAQGAHASLATLLGSARREDGMLVIPLTAANEPWLFGYFTKTCCGVDSEAELLEIHRKAQEAGIATTLITDAGFTEFHGVPTHTAVAVGPDLVDKIDAVTGYLKLL